MRIARALGLALYGVLGARAVILLDLGIGPPFFDFQIYARAFHDAITSANPYAIRSIGTAFIYPPQALLLLAPILALPLGILQDALWLALNVGLLVGMLVADHAPVRH